MSGVDEKRIKQEFKKKAQKNPEKYYPVGFLESEGFVRRQCKKCGTFFWTTDENREVCDDPNCTGFYSFIGNSPSSARMDFIKVWREFAKLFEKLGYTPINRYPVVARWRDDLEFVIASIADFQPHVVSGEVEPPANPLVVPQFCLRFTDIENVGITGRHYTGFVMIGQHAFVPAEKYDQEKYLADIYAWLRKGLKLPKEEITFHEDAWAGGGNMGPSMEFFSRSLEIGNQVYMMFDIREGNIKELPIKVLDMGMGQERCAWLTLATSTSYEANMPEVVELLYGLTGIKPHHNIIEAFLPYSGILNVDELEDVKKAWNLIAERIGIDVEMLKEAILPAAAIYAIADHTRSLLFAIGDGALPSNVGGGYNLRVIMRRVFDLMEEHGWAFDLEKVLEAHASYMKPQYPELEEVVEHVARIFDVERKKYESTKRMVREIVSRLKKEELTEEKLIELYDSRGISPEMLVKEGIIDAVPRDFYTRLAAKYAEARRKELEKKRKEEKRKLEFDVGELPPTRILYYDDYRLFKFRARVVKAHGNYIVLDATAFYPTSGGQLHDVGWLDGVKVIDVFKAGKVIVHEVEDGSKFREGVEVEGKIDMERRIKLTQLHTATHIIGGAARKIIGRHVWQAGAEKRPEKARLDITHYEALDEETIRRIEDEANRIVMLNIPVESRLMHRNDAEREFGFVIYQGGAVPGRELRIIKIDDFDVQACGGTHVRSTAELGPIKIIGTSKIQDGVVRLEFVAGLSLLEHLRKMESYIKESCAVLDVTPPHLPRAVRRFFDEWKRQRKEIEELKTKLNQVLAKTLEGEEKEMDGVRFMLIKTEGQELRDVLRMASEKAKNSRVPVVVVNSCGKGAQIVVSYSDESRDAAARLRELLESRLSIRMKPGRNVWVGGSRAEDIVALMGKL